MLSKTPVLTIGAAVIAGGLILSSWYLSTGSAADNTNNADVTPVEVSPTPYVTRAPDEIDLQLPNPLPTGRVSISEGDDPAMGDPEAVVQLVEYSDYQCPLCANFHNNYFARFKEEYIDTGLVRYVYKDFPIEKHKSAKFASYSANCVEYLSDTDTFFQYNELLYGRQTDWSPSNDPKEFFLSYAVELGIDSEEFAMCFVNRPIADQIEEDIAEGGELGVPGTPLFFLNGRPLVGTAPTYEDFANEIEKDLAAYAR